MKRVIAILLVFALGLVMLAGCGGGSGNNNSGNNNSESNNASTDNGETSSAVEDVAVLAPYTVDMTSDELWDTYKEFSKDISLIDITYEKLVALLGVDGELSAENSSETNNFYIWHSNDGGGLVVLFKKEGGGFVSASQSYPS